MVADAEAGYTAVQSQKAVSTYFSSKQILPSGFADQYIKGGVSREPGVCDNWLLWLRQVLH